MENAMTRLQAHRGVCTEYPENTMAAFRGAILQGYEVIELDPNVTADGKFIVLHDDTITRTARNQNGDIPEETRKVSEMTYAEITEYDFGFWFSPKFKGEKIPLLEDVLRLAETYPVHLKIDNKIWKFSDELLEDFWELLNHSKASVGITCKNLETVQIAVEKVPFAEIHYDGEVTEEQLQKIHKLTKRLTVWMPLQTEATSWVKVPFASEELCNLVKNYAKLGIWLISKDEDFELVEKLYQPDIVETPGQIKPIKNRGCVVDMHTHSHYSHDSQCFVGDMAFYQREKGNYGFAVTDHCDVFKADCENVTIGIFSSVKEVEEFRNKENKDEFQVLTGVEVGEGIWLPEIVQELLEHGTYDVVIASVHTVRYLHEGKPFSVRDFSEMGEEHLYGYMKKYYEEVYETISTIPCDIAAHLNIPLRYMNGKYQRGVDCKRFEEMIRKILAALIKRGIALEINTSCMEPDGVDHLEQDWLLGIYREMGGQLVTLGSDAHVQEKAAQNFERGLELLRKHGFKNCFYFKERNCIQCSLG